MGAKRHAPGFIFFSYRARRGAAHSPRRPRHIHRRGDLSFLFPCKARPRKQRPARATFAQPGRSPAGGFYTGPWSA